MRRLREGGVDGLRVAIGPVKRDIAGRLRMQRGGRGIHGPLDVGGHGQIVIVDGDGFGGVLRLRQSLRDHDRHRLTDIADLIDRQHRDASSKHRLAVAAGGACNRRDSA